MRLIRRRKMTLAGDLALFAKTLSEDTEHGASHILKIAAGSLHTALKRNPEAPPSEIQAEVKEYALRLISGQRQMASILNFSNRLLIELSKNENQKDIGKKIWDFAVEISRSSSEAIIKISGHSAIAISGNSFLTHSRSSTLLHFLSQARDRKGLSVYCTYSRPGGEGRLLSGELAVAGVRAELIEDSEIMKFLPDCAALLIGADAVIPGGIVNKIGTHMMCLSAHELRIPIYCLTDSMKLWPFNDPISRGLRSKTIKQVPGLDLFEITPGSLTTKIVFETGAKEFKDIKFNTDPTGIASEIRKLFMP